MKDKQALLDAYLDQTISPAELERLQELIQSDPETARRLTEELLFEQRLQTEVRSKAL